MAQLPPKPPNMTHNWHSFPYHHHHRPEVIPANMTTAGNTQQQNPQQHQPCWVDEFLDFSSARRSTHRRSFSDSIAFIEECRNSDSPAGGGNAGFVGLDDEQLLTMFPDEVGLAAPPTVSSSNPSTPSDDEEKPAVLDQHRQQGKNEPGEEDSSSQSDPQKSTTPPSAAASGDTIVDPKRVKRILANRQSAQRSRVRKLQYISELERSVTTLQTEVSALSPKVAFLDHQRLILNVDNSALKQRIAALAQDKIFKDAHQEALKKEIERLRQVYHQQSMKKNMGTTNTTTTGPPPQPPPPTSGCTDTDQLLN